MATPKQVPGIPIDALILPGTREIDARHVAPRSLLQEANTLERYLVWRLYRRIGRRALDQATLLPLPSALHAALLDFVKSWERKHRVVAQIARETQTRADDAV